MVARCSGGLAGFVSVWTADLFLHHLYVTPSYQRRGIGQALIEHCIEHFGLPLSLKCLKSNTSACAFYERLGWRVVGEGDSVDGPYLMYRILNR